VDRKLGLIVMGLGVLCGVIALGTGGCTGAPGAGTPGNSLTPDTPSDTTPSANDSARRSVTFTLNLAQDDGAQAAARGLAPRLGVEYPYDATEPDSISILKEGVRLGNDCVGDDGSHRTFNVFLMNETGDAMRDIQVEVVSCDGATPDATLFDYGDLADGEGGPGPAWDEVDGNEQVWSFSYTGPLDLTATVSVSWGLPRTAKIAFFSSRDGDYEIFAMDPDGSNVTQLTSNSVTDVNARWSPNGTKIVYLSQNEVWTMNADGSGQTRLTTGADSSGADWSPDGTKIVFHGQVSVNNNGIFVMNSDGTGVTHLTTSGENETYPSWSPDGTRIAYSRGGSYPDLWIMDADGTGQSLVLAHAQNDNAARWSPDGSLLLFGCFDPSPGDVYTVHPDGASLTQLTTSADHEAGPCWSPDGTKIALHRGGWGTSERIWVMNADGTGAVQISSGPGRDLCPSWQPLP